MTDLSLPAQKAVQLPEKKSFHEQPILIALFLWWFQYIPGKIWEIAQKTVAKLYDFFSITLLLSTLTQPWKRDEIDSSNLSLDLKIRAWMMNLVSIFVGFIIRSTTIVFGLCAICLVFIAAIAFLAVFCLLPIFSLFMIYMGIFS